MSKIAVWCRHKNDNIIGIGPHIPWYVSSDFQRFKRITLNENILAGEKTYESFPNRTLPNRKILVLTFNKEYEVSDPKNHFVVNDINILKEYEEDLYICGGASIYDLLMTHKSNKLNPDIVVESVYMGDLKEDLEGNIIDISKSVEALQKSYRKISKDYEQDNIITTVYVKKNAFIEQSSLKKIINAIEEGM